MVLENTDFHLDKVKYMELINSFINYLCCLDLSQDLCKISNDMYNELETLDVDLSEKAVIMNSDWPYSVRTKIVELIEFYYLKADDCLNKYSDKEVYKFLRELKKRAEEISAYIMD